MDLVEDVNKIADALIKKWKISNYEALQIAVKIQHNQVLSDAFLLYDGDKSALESIAMGLGIGDENRKSIPRALQSIAEEICGVRISTE